MLVVSMVTVYDIFPRLGIPKEELPSLVGGGRYWDQPSIGLADIKLYVCKRIVPPSFRSRHTSTSGIFVPSTTNSGAWLGSELKTTSTMH